MSRIRTKYQRYNVIKSYSPCTFDGWQRVQPHAHFASIAASEHDRGGREARAVAWARTLRVRQLEVAQGHHAALKK